MSYYYDNGNLNSDTDASTKNIAKTSSSTKLASDVLISKTIISSDNSASYFKYDDNTGYYLKKSDSSATSVIAGRWGDVSHPAATYFKYGDSSVPFVDSISCPMFKDDSTQGQIAISSWGDKQVAAGKTVYLASTSGNTGTGDVGIWYSEDNSTWTKLKSGHSLCFIDLQGGGGGGMYAKDAGGYIYSGGGGSGGGYIRAALDLSKTGLVTIVVGTGGTGGISSSETNPGKGGNTTLKSTSGLSISARGGGIGYYDTYDHISYGGSSAGMSVAQNWDKGLMKVYYKNGTSGGRGSSVYFYAPQECYSQAANGTGFDTSETYSSFDLLKSDANAKINVADKHGFSGKMYIKYTEANGYSYSFGNNVYLTNGFAGGGGGASALGGGSTSTTSRSVTGYGGGGTGGAIGFGASGYQTAEINGQNGGDGRCIIHYNYRKV